MLVHLPIILVIDAMKTTNGNRKVYKDGCRVAYTEYEVRPLNEHGDCIDVDHFDTGQESIASAHKYMAGGALAVVVEKHVSRYPACMFRESDTYKTLLRLGSATILERGNWK